MKSLLFRLKPLHIGEPADSGLKRVLGPGHLIALGVGSAIGAGLFAITGVAAGSYAGPAVSISFLISALVCSLTGLCYAELSAMFPHASGATYSYAYAGMGELPAWLAGWSIGLSYLFTLGLVGVSWSGYLSSFLHTCGMNLDPRLLASTGTLVTLTSGESVRAWINLPAIFILVTIASLMMGGLQESARINNLMVALKVAVIIAFVVLCFPAIHPSNYHPFISPNEGVFGAFGISGIVRGAGLVFVAYLGFDVVAAAARDAKEPERNLPIGILGTLISCAAIYILFAAVLVGVVHYKLLANDASPVALALNIAKRPELGELVELSILIGFCAVLYGMYLGLSRIILAMAGDGLLPSVFAHLSPKTGAPRRAIMLVTLIGCLLAGFFPIKALGNLTSMSTLLSFLTACLTVYALRRRFPEMERPFRVTGGSILIPFSGALSCGVLMLSMDALTWVFEVSALAIGMAVYFLYGMRHAHLARNL